MKTKLWLTVAGLGSILAFNLIAQSAIGKDALNAIVSVPMPTPTPQQPQVVPVPSPQSPYVSDTQTVPAPQPTTTPQPQVEPLPMPQQQTAPEPKQQFRCFSKTCGMRIRQSADLSTYANITGVVLNGRTVQTEKGQAFVDSTLCQGETGSWVRVSASRADVRPDRRQTAPIQLSGYMATCGLQFHDEAIQGGW